MEAQRRAACTEMEGRVLALLCLGWSNRRIADELVLSVRTVEMHVGHILGKLGAGNRTEAAVIALRRDRSKD